MLCQVYRSSKRAETYLYVKMGTDLTTLPEQLTAKLGELNSVLIIDLNKRDKLANADINKVKAAITEQSFYLQLPPGPEKFLKMADK